MQAVLPRHEQNVVHYIFGQDSDNDLWLKLVYGHQFGRDMNWSGRWSEICYPGKRHITVVRVTHDEANKRLREAYIINMVLVLQATFPHAIAADIVSRVLPTAQCAMIPDKLVAKDPDPEQVTSAPKAKIKMHTWRQQNRALTRLKSLKNF